MAAPGTTTEGAPTTTVAVTEREARLLLDLLVSQMGMMRISAITEIQVLSDKLVRPLHAKVNEALAAFEAGR